MAKDEAININPEDVHITKRRRNPQAFDMFGFGGGLFESILGGLFGNFFSFEEEEEEEYCDFNDVDYRFINPKLRIINPKKMIVLNKEDLKKDNPNLK